MIAIGRITLPDGRKLLAVEHGTHESDVNAWVSDGDMTITNVDTDEELSVDAQNEILVIAGKEWYLHEYISMHATWDIEPDTLDED